MMFLWLSTCSCTMAQPFQDDVIGGQTNDPTINWGEQLDQTTARTNPPYTKVNTFAIRVWFQTPGEYYRRVDQVEGCIRTQQLDGTWKTKTVWKTLWRDPAPIKCNGQNTLMWTPTVTLLDPHRIPDIDGGVKAGNSQIIRVVLERTKGNPNEPEIPNRPADWYYSNIITLTVDGTSLTEPPTAFLTPSTTCSNFGIMSK